MDKNKLIKVVVKEIQELEILAKNFSDKIDNVKKLIELLEKSQQSIVDNQQSTEESQKQTGNSQESRLVENVEIIEEKPAEIDSVITKEAIHIVEEEKPEIAIEKEPEFIAEEVIPAPIIEKKTTTPKKNILADTIKTTSLNEKLSEKANKSLDQVLSNKKITDLKRSISLNDKFRFQREIFSGNAALLNQTLELLNEMENKEDTIEFLSNLNLDDENPIVAEFLELVNRKFY